MSIIYDLYDIVGINNVEESAKEENSLVKINPLPIIKDEDKSFFYKCACLYKKEEYKYENIFIKLFVIFFYKKYNTYNLTIVCFILPLFILSIINIIGIHYSLLLWHFFISVILIMLFYLSIIPIYFISDAYIIRYEFYNNGLNKKDYIDYKNQDEYNHTEYINNKKQEKKNLAK